MGNCTTLKHWSKLFHDWLHLYYTLVCRVVKKTKLLSRSFQLSRVSQAVGLLLQWQIISCVILNVGAVWLNVRGDVV